MTLDDNSEWYETPDEIWVANWSSMTIESEEDPQEDLWLTLSYSSQVFGGVWYVSGVDCPSEDETPAP